MSPPLPLLPAASAEELLPERRRRPCQTIAQAVDTAAAKLGSRHL